LPGREMTGGEYVRQAMSYTMYGCMLAASSTNSIMEEREHSADIVRLQCHVFRRMYVRDKLPCHCERNCYVVNNINDKLS